MIIKHKDDTLYLHIRNEHLDEMRETAFQRLKEEHPDGIIPLKKWEQIRSYFDDANTDAQIRHVYCIVDGTLP